MEKQETLDGRSIVNLELLKSYVSEMTSLNAVCESARSLAVKEESPMILIGEEKHGLTSILSVKCNGCGKMY